MANIALLLGPIVFQDFEVPERIGFGGSQRVVTHDLPGGGRVVDTLGGQDAQIVFSGVFSGADAAARALELDALRVVGAPLPLTWDVFFYLVVLESFQADYRKSSWIPFRITCTVVTSAVDLAVGLAGSLLSALQGDGAAATSLAQPAGVDLSGVGSAVGASGATTRGSAAYVLAQGSVQAGQSSLTSGIAGAEGQIGGLSGGTGLLGATSAAGGIANLTTATSAAHSLAGLTAAQGYLGRAGANLSNAST